jgi:NADH-quinone oxidoreductase subunit M
MLFTIILMPLMACFFLCFVDKTRHVFIRNFGLFWSLIILNACCGLLFFFDPTVPFFQFLEVNNWFSAININCIFGVDGLALILIILTAFLTPICIMLCWNRSLVNNAKDYIIAYFLLESILFAVFSCLDVMLFYLLFEAVLIPMFLIVGFYGSRGRKVRSAYMLFLYTLFSSLIMFLAILYIYFKFGSTDYLVLKTIVFDPLSEKLCWIAFFFPLP